MSETPPKTDPSTSLGASGDPAAIPAAPSTSLGASGDPAAIPAAPSTSLGASGDPAATSAAATSAAPTSAAATSAAATSAAATSAAATSAAATSAAPTSAAATSAAPTSAAPTSATLATSAATPAPSAHAWDLVKKLKADGLDRPQMIEKLKATGLDQESAIVLINSVAGALPVDLPNAQLSPGINVLSPSTFTLSDIGLTGPPTTVGLYWMGFGAAILLALGLGFIMTETLGRELPEDVGFYALRIGGFVSMCCVGWGVFRYSQGITIRRK